LLKYCSDHSQLLIEILMLSLPQATDSITHVISHTIL